MFQVDTVQLGMYAGIVKAHGQDSVAARQFAEKSLQIGAQPGLLAEFVGSHEEAKHDIVAALQNLEAVCSASGTELERAGQMYDTVDKDSADSLDRTYPDPGGPTKLPDLPGMPSPSERQAVIQTTFPNGRLTEPKKPDGFHNPIQILNDLGNMISPGYWAQKFLEVTIRVNPVQEFSNWIAGDWEQFAKASDALNSLSWFCSDVGQDVLINMSALSTQWTGNASNEAYHYFNTLGSLIKGHGEALATLRDKYNEAAQGVWEFSESINDIIQGIFDSIFWGTLEAIAGGALAETGIGAAALWGLAALECKDIVEGWKRATNLLMNIQNATRIIHGGVLDVIGTNGAFQAHPLPAGYNHPGV
ncbi:hypothetical protein ACFQ1S_03080 [Kibdelosporangium lantanae]|uniref:WXG100 family type VII secretion target n=1 Tax=Kibdelosporangium lantanae TaxID=1497396 RepID=A0ABW3M1Z9_9PSEU